VAAERPFVIRALTEELPLKLISLVIAVTLFVIVRSDRDAAGGVDVKVVYNLPPDQVLASAPLSTVRIGVRGAWTRLSRLQDRGLDPLRVDVRQARDGIYRFDESQVKLPPGLKLAWFSPAEVRVDLEPRAVKEVVVEPLLEGRPADGFQLGKVTATPSVVRIDGPKSVVDAFTRAHTRPFKISGAATPALGEVQLADPPPRAQWADVTTVRVNADIQPAIVERVFAVVPVQAEGLTRLAATVEPLAVDIIVRGPSDKLSALGQESVTASVDAQLLDSRPPARWVRPVQVGGLPAGVAAEVHPSSVAVTTRRK
jgi:hypothetical protein